ncbi:MAG TPA: CPBP family intramembrane glutamic endopeptidase [Actinomycetota bacterium]|nr:CPBP family intramembrane glutamic endopeptidase [Actinomycetota bacterium]
MASVLRRPEGTAPLSAPPWRAWEAAVVFGVGYVLGDLLRSPLGGSAVEREAGVVVVEATWTALLLLWLRGSHPGWATRLGQPSRPWAEVREGAVFGSILYGVIGLAVALPLVRTMGLGEEAAAGARASASPSSVVEVLVAATSALVVAPVAEEFFFRGLLFTAARARTGTVPATLASAALFGVVHFAPASPAASLVPAAIACCLGVGLAVLYERRANLLAPLGAHVAFNAIGLVVLFTRG